MLMLRMVARRIHILVLQLLCSGRAKIGVMDWLCLIAAENVLRKDLAWKKIQGESAGRLCRETIGWR